jgi:hypothetical protein
MNSQNGYSLCSYRFYSFFNSIKRLPHPNASRNVISPQSSSAFARQKAENYSINREDALPSTSSLSLSRFNFPKPPDASSSRRVNENPYSIALPEIPQLFYEETPKVLRYSGASFDLVNPHDSLRLSDILPSAELESAMSDYVASAAQHEEPSAAPQPKRFANLQEAFAAVRNGKGLYRHITAICPALTFLVPTIQECSVTSAAVPTSQEDSSTVQDQVYDTRQEGGLDINESRYPSSYYPDTTSIVEQRLSQQPVGHDLRLRDYDDKLDDNSRSRISPHSIVLPHFLDDETGSTYSLAGFQGRSQQIEEQAARREQGTGTISGIIRNYQDPRVGVAATSGQASDYEWKDQPLLSRTDSQHREDYYRVHGCYPRKHFKSPTRSDTTIDEKQSTHSGEEFMRSSESNPNLSVNSEGRRLPPVDSLKSPVPRQSLPFMHPLTSIPNYPAGPPTWAPPHTPDIPRPLFFKDASSRTFSNVGKSYTSTGELLAMTSPLHRVQQPPPTDWPFRGLHPRPIMDQLNGLSSLHTGRQASYNREDISDLCTHQADSGLVAFQNASRSIPTMWTRQSSGPTYLRRDTQNDSEEESFADMSDDDPAQPRIPQVPSGVNTVRNSGTDWETIPNGTSVGGSQPELPTLRGITYKEKRHEELQRCEEQTDSYKSLLRNAVDAAPRVHGAAGNFPTPEQRGEYLSYSPYAMQENWERNGSLNNYGTNSYRPRALYPRRQQPVRMADEELSPEPNDGIEYDDDFRTHRGCDLPDAARPNLRDSQMSYYYPTAQTTGGYFPPRVSSMPQHRRADLLSRPVAQVITEPPEAYLGQRARAWTRSDAPTSSYAGSHRHASNTRSVDPLVSHNGSTTEVEMTPIGGSRRYSRLPMAKSLRNSVRRSVARQTDLQPLHLSPTNGRQSAVTDVTTWGGFLNHLKASGHGKTTPPLVQYAKNAPDVIAQQTALRRQESASYLLPYGTELEEQMSGKKHMHRHAYRFSVLILCVSALFIIFLPLYFWGVLDLLIQKYTNGVKQTYPKKLKTIAVAIFSVELSSIFVAALMAGLMGRN